MGKFKFDWNGIKDKIKEEGAKKGFEKDTRFWKPTTDEKGNGLAIIRFLPDPTGEVWAKLYTHNFNYQKDGIKKYWIKNCINTFGYDKNCPICAKNHELYNSAFEEDKKIAGQRKRKLKYISNILVISDKANPENEGKVFLYEYGTKIQEKLQKRITPTDADREDPDFQEFMPFDFYEGANFKIKVKKQGDYPNYDDSEFSAQSELLGGDDKKIEKIFGCTYKLDEFLSEDKFPTNEETINALGSILGIVNSTKKTDKKQTTKEQFEPEDVVDNAIDEEFTTDTSNDSSGSSEYDDDMQFFESLK